MQRAAASSPNPTPSSKASNPQIESGQTPPSKRRRLDTRTPDYSTPTSPPELLQIQAAVNEEEAKRERAIERLAEEVGETKWILSTVDGDEGEEPDSLGQRGGMLRVTNAGYADIDSEPWRPAEAGRRSFGKFNKELEVRCNSFFIVMRVLDNRISIH